MCYVHLGGTKMYRWKKPSGVEKYEETHSSRCGKSASPVKK